MAMINPVKRMKELIVRIKEADEAYYVRNAAIMTDAEYDDMTAELGRLEQDTGIVFSDSPTNHVSGDKDDAFTPVTHTKPMLSCKKTKAVGDVIAFADVKGITRDLVMSRKLDGLSLILRYEDGTFVQAITRGREGLVGEDVTHTVRHMRGVPARIPFKDSLEVRGEGVLSWADHEAIREGEGEVQPRSIASGAVRSLVADEGKLSHIDFVAYELVEPRDLYPTKTEQLSFLSENRFEVVEHLLCRAHEDDIAARLEELPAAGSPYPVDGVVIELNDMALGRSLGATAHHENRMLAYKWEDTRYETVFRGIEMSVTRTGTVELNAIFDPVNIDGGEIHRANIHGLSGFRRLALGIGDRLEVHRSNMVVPEVAENLTRSGGYALDAYCPCCRTPLEERRSRGGREHLYCPNEECLARNAQRLARFCDRRGMNIDGLPAHVLQTLMERGYIKSFADIYHLAEHRDRLINERRLGIGDLSELLKCIENSRYTTLSRFLYAVGIPLLGPEAAKHIGNYYGESFAKFRAAAEKEFNFSRIEGISSAVAKQIYEWYINMSSWAPLLKELHFPGDADLTDGAGDFRDKRIALLGNVSDERYRSLADALASLGATVVSQSDADTDFLLVALK